MYLAIYSFICLFIYLVIYLFVCLFILFLKTWKGQVLCAIVSIDNWEQYHLLTCIYSTCTLWKGKVINVVGRRMLEEWIKCNMYNVVLEWIHIPGGPIKTEQSIQSIFQDFSLINSYIFSPCWIEHLFLIIITPRSSNLVENFLFYE